MDNQIKVLLWKEKNQQKIKDGQKLYFKKNKEKINNRRRYRFLFDVNYRLRTLLRCRLHKAIKRNVKQGSAIKDLGCSIPELKQKIEKMFQFGMNWNNWGYGKDKWHLDHIKSLSSFDLSDRIQFLKACHYSNLQPLWQLDNMKKG